MTRPMSTAISLTRWLCRAVYGSRLSTASASAPIVCVNISRISTNRCEAMSGRVERQREQQRRPPLRTSRRSTSTIRGALAPGCCTAVPREVARWSPPDSDCPVRSAEDPPRGQVQNEEDACRRSSADELAHSAIPGARSQAALPCTSQRLSPGGPTPAWFAKRAIPRDPAAQLPHLGGPDSGNPATDRGPTKGHRCDDRAPWRRPGVTRLGAEPASAEATSVNTVQNTMPEKDFSPGLGMPPPSRRRSAILAIDQPEKQESQPRVQRHSEPRLRRCIAFRDFGMDCLVR